MLKLTGGADKTDAWLTAILDRIHDYAKLYGKPYDTNIYAGIYALRAEDRDLNEIIFQASQGAYGAEKEDCRYLRCSKGMMDQFMQERQLQASIEQAFAQKEFQLYIQFYVDAANFAVVGGEALSRWKHPQKGVLLPSMFIPLMEREKMISRLGYYCLKEVCFFLEGLLKEGVDTFFVSCNFSRDTFAAADFVQKVQEIMNGFTFPRELLILEITESVSVRNAAQIRQNIIALKKYGVRVALGDFGEGFTSFYDLQKYPIDGIKLDKGLVDHVTTPIGTAILSSLSRSEHLLWNMVNSVMIFPFMPVLPSEKNGKKPCWPCRASSIPTIRILPFIIMTCIMPYGRKTALKARCIRLCRIKSSNCSYSLSSV